MKEIQNLIIHCSATPEGRNYGKNFFDLIHKAPPPSGRGWKKYGYNDIIDLNGKIIELEPSNYDKIMHNSEIANGVAGLNATSIHVCYIGGMSADMKKPKNTMTAAQEMALLFYVNRCLLHNPNIIISGHNQWQNKACPSFNVVWWCIANNIEEKNISKRALIGM